MGSEPINSTKLFHMIPFTVLRCKQEKFQLQMFRRELFSQHQLMRKPQLSEVSKISGLLPLTTEEICLKITMKQQLLIVKNHVSIILAVNSFRPKFLFR